MSLYINVNKYLYSVYHIYTDMKRICLIGLTLFLIVSPSISAKTTDIIHNEKPLYWGPILYKDINLSHYEYDYNDKWGIVFLFSYDIIALGRHKIQWEIDYDIYAENKTKHYNDSRDGWSYMWTFSIFFHPHINIRNFLDIELSSNLYDYGTVTGRFYIDEELVWNETIFYDYWAEK